MAKLGTERKPVRFRVQTEERLGKIAQICEENGWIFVGGLESDEPEDIREVEYLLNPKAFSSGVSHLYYVESNKSGGG